MRFALSFENCK